MHRFSQLILLAGGVLLTLASAVDAQVASPGGALQLRPTQVPSSATPPPVVAPQVVDDGGAGRAVRQTTVQNDAVVDDTETASVRVVRRAPEIDPYEPIGISAGGFTLYPSLTTSFGQTSNAAGAAGGTASAYGILSPELMLRSNWARHQATFDLKGSYEHFFDGTTDDKPEVDAAATARLDVTNAATVPLSASYGFKTQAFSDPDFPAGVDSPPGVHELKGSVGLDRTGPTVIQFNVSADRTLYENGTSGGLPVDQSDRTNTVFAAKLRLGYQLSPSFTPFVEAEAGRRVFDRTVDNNGLRRSGVLTYYRAGVALDRGPILQGEIALGYGIATFDDPVLSAVHAFTADGSLIWSPTRLTTITFAANTGLNPSTDPTSSGSVVYDGSVDLAYAWRQNVTIDAKAGARNEKTQGSGQSDTDTTAGLSGTWKANRSLWLTAGYQHEWLTSNLPGRAFQSDAVRLEVKTQR